MKILIVDDSTMIRQILRGLLKQLGHTDVIQSPNGEEALEQLRSNAVDLVLLDIHMPGMGGISLLKLLRSSPEFEKMPVIIISADTDPSQTERAISLGAQSFINKPFKLDGLREAMDKALQSGDGTESA